MSGKKQKFAVVALVVAAVFSMGATPANVAQQVDSAICNEYKGRALYLASQFKLLTGDVDTALRLQDRAASLLACANKS